MPGYSKPAAQGVSFPLFVFVVLALGILVEVVESQDRRAGYVLAVILLLGMITFNSRAFQIGINGTIGVLSGKAGTKVKPPTKKG